MSKIVNALIGHTLGDAMGTPVEFFNRKYLQENKVKEMLGNIGQHKEPIGSWSDDTSMELATIDSIINKNTIDYNDIMNNFLLWLEQGKYTPTNHPFGVGRTCLMALYNYKKGKPSLECGNNDDRHMSNGSLMRILPIALYSYSKKLSIEEIETITNNVSSLTHNQEAVRLACFIYVMYIIDLLNGLSKEEAYTNIKNRKYNYSDTALKMYDRLLKEDIRKLKIDEINSSGYIVDTLEASFWCLLTNSSYEDTIIEAVNLGQDTDTIAAICGSMAGIIYGMNSFPSRWLDKLQQKDYLLNLFIKFEKIIENN